jgi:O-methyltransferase
VLREQPPDPIAFLHVDLNNSAAEIAALDQLYESTVPGGVIVFDDYCWAASRAQFVAEREWFERRGLVVMPLPTGQGVFVKR